MPQALLRNLCKDDFVCGEEKTTAAKANKTQLHELTQRTASSFPPLPPPGYYGVCDGFLGSKLPMTQLMCGCVGLPEGRQRAGTSHSPAGRNTAESHPPPSADHRVIYAHT